MRRGVEGIRRAGVPRKRRRRRAARQAHSFPQSVLLEEGEVVLFSWIVFESRARRDEINDKVMHDPRVAHYMDPANMPFDGKRMIYGGFEMIIDL
jgi:uncharacterized protein YbaA (DUF1428 family)